MEAPLAEKVTRDSPLAARKQEALKLRKGGSSPGAIAKRLGFTNGAAVDRIVAQLLAKDQPVDSALRWQELELARLDDLQISLSARVGARERGAERDLMRVIDYRIRLQSARDRGPGRMFTAVQTAIAALDLSPADEAAKQSALDMAAMIDVAMSMGTADDQRRAINAMATMRNLLSDLGASPAAREELDGIVTGGRSPAAATDAQQESDPEKGAEVLDFMARAQQRMKAAQ